MKQQNPQPEAINDVESIRKIIIDMKSIFEERHIQNIENMEKLKREQFEKEQFTDLIASNFSEENKNLQAIKEKITMAQELIGKQQKEKQCEYDYDYDTVD